MYAWHEFNKMSKMNYIKSMQNVLDLIHDNIQEHLAFNINILILIFLRYILFSISLFRSLVVFFKFRWEEEITKHGSSLHINTKLLGSHSGDVVCVVDRDEVDGEGFIAETGWM